MKDSRLLCGFIVWLLDYPKFGEIAERNNGVENKKDTSIYRQKSRYSIDDKKGNLSNAETQPSC